MLKKFLVTLGGFVAVFLVLGGVKAAQVKKPTKQAYDPTLAATRGAEERDDSEAKEIFKEMKRREF